MGIAGSAGYLQAFWGAQKPLCPHALPTDLPEVRLADGGGRCEGRVEVRHDGTWGTVCDDLWDLPAAQVVCRQLGCGPALAAPRNSMFGDGVGPILLDNVQCVGDETSLGRCHHLGVSVHNCGHHEDAGAVCSGTSPSRLHRQTDHPQMRPLNSSAQPRFLPASPWSREPVKLRHPRTQS